MKSFGKVMKGFTGIIGRESKKKSGKQGIHHHPMESQLGDGIAKGIQPGPRQAAGMKEPC